LTACFTVSAFAADYSFSSGNDTWSGFGGSTSVDTPTTPDPMSSNERRNKDAAFLPPHYGIFSGSIPTNASSPYHDNLPQGGPIPQAQDLPPVGNENYAPGSSDVSVGFLPTTSQTSTLNTVPWYYEDGSIGTLYVSRTGKTIKVYEGETLDNLKKARGISAVPPHGTATWRSRAITVADPRISVSSRTWKTATG
jgi:sortase A